MPSVRQMSNFPPLPVTDLFSALAREKRNAPNYFLEDEVDERVLKLTADIRSLLKGTPGLPATENVDNTFNEVEPLQRQISVDDSESSSSRLPHSESVTIPILNTPWGDKIMHRTSDSKETIKRMYCKLDLFGKLHEEICALITWMEPSAEEIEARELVIEHVEKVVRSLWPTARVSRFGSYYSGLALPNGDIDLCVFCPSLPQNAPKLLAYNIYQTKLGERIQVVENAKVPVCKFVHKVTGVSVDVCFNQNSSQTTSKFVVDNLKMYPWMKCLVMVLKLYLLQRGLSETYKGGVGSYLVFVMVLSLLQNSRITFDTSSCYHTNLGHLLAKFFEFYGSEFNYERVAISVAHGGEYFRKDGRWCHDNKRYLFAVESPLDQHTDLGKNSYNIIKIKTVFFHSYQRLRWLHKLMTESSMQGPSVSNSQIHSQRVTGHDSVLATLINTHDPLFVNRDRSLLLMKNKLTSSTINIRS